jgi:hypothetical protein
VLHVYPGLGSGVRNVPFTHKAQIAFVDTERWNDRKKEPLRRISPYLSEKSRELAEKFLRK